MTTRNDDDDARDEDETDWAGDDALSKLVDAAISNELLYERVMKPWRDGR